MSDSDGADNSSSSLPSLRGVRRQDSAPAGVEVQPGDQVRRASTGDLGVVLSSRDDLVEVAFGAGKTTIHIDDLVRAAKDPAEELSAGSFGHALPYSLRLQSLYLRHAYRYDPLSGLSNARVEPQLHQVYVAHRVTRKLQPRMILADEVGLGKTIEAGLILKELRARGLVDRVLIIVPANLQIQWQNELRSKFNEQFEVIDGDAARHFSKGGKNPFAVADNVICSLPFAAMEKRQEQITELGWDLVVFDEAHRVRRRKEHTTKAYHLADEIKENASGLLLLTATPMQLDPYELYSHIELVEPGLYPGYDSYARQRDRLPRLNEAMRDIQKWRALMPGDRAAVLRRVCGLLNDLGVAPGDHESVLDDDESRESLMDRMVEEHPLSQVLVRNRKAEVGGFTPRVARQHLIDPRPDELALYEDVTEYLRSGYNQAQAEKNMALGFLMVTYHKMLASSAYAIMQSLSRRIEKLRVQARAAEAHHRRLTRPEADLWRDQDDLGATVDDIAGEVLDPAKINAEIAELQGLVERLKDVEESKPVALLDLVDATEQAEPGTKILIFTQFLETQRYLSELLSANGYSVASFNGSMNLEEKERAVRRFREEAQILISTEAGGEGRNFQFCHVLVNYDLPWNPMRVEQRIGRLDRIGQRHPVQVHNLAVRDTVEERVLEVLANRIRLFEESVGSLDPILGSIEKEIEDIVLTGDTKAFRRLEIDLQQRVLEAREKERTLADFVMDRASLRRDVANELLEQSPLARHQDLEDFVQRCLDYFGGVVTETDEGQRVISLSPGLASALKTSGQVVRGAFDPQVALREEDDAFFAFGHELIERILDLPTESDPVPVAAYVGSEGETDRVELYYELQSVGGRPAGRFIRHLAGEDGDVVSQPVEKMPPVVASATAEVLPTWLSTAVEASRKHAQHEYLAFRTAVRDEHEESKRDRFDRLERIREYRQRRLTYEVERLSQLAAEQAASEREGTRRIARATRGRAEANKVRLEQLADEHQRELDRIKNEQADADMRVVAAAYVVSG